MIMFKKSMLFAAVLCCAGSVFSVVVKPLVEGVSVIDLGQASGVKFFYSKCSELPKAANMSLRDFDALILKKQDVVARFDWAKPEQSVVVQVLFNATATDIAPGTKQPTPVRHSSLSDEAVAKSGLSDGGFTDVRIYGTRNNPSLAVFEFIKASCVKKADSSTVKFVKTLMLRGFYATAAGLAALGIYVTAAPDHAKALTLRIAEPVINFKFVREKWPLISFDLSRAIISHKQQFQALRQYSENASQGLGKESSPVEDVSIDEAIIRFFNNRASENKILKPIIISAREVSLEAAVSDILAGALTTPKILIVPYLKIDQDLETSDASVFRKNCAALKNSNCLIAIYGGVGDVYSDLPLKSESDESLAFLHVQARGLGFYSISSSFAKTIAVNKQIDLRSCFYWSYFAWFYKTFDGSDLNLEECFPQDAKPASSSEGSGAAAASGAGSEPCVASGAAARRAPAPSPVVLKTPMAQCVVDSLNAVGAQANVQFLGSLESLKDGFEGLRIFVCDRSFLVENKDSIKDHADKYRAGDTKTQLLILNDQGEEWAFYPEGKLKPKKLGFIWGDKCGIVWLGFKSSDLKGLFAKELEYEADGKLKAKSIYRLLNQLLKLGIPPCVDSE